MVDEHEASAYNLWASREAVAQQIVLASREAVRPSTVPVIDLSRISDLQEEWEEYDPPEQDQEGVVVSVHY
jgi:hypothetical protein